MADLLELMGKPALTPAERRRLRGGTQRRGYAYFPGTGPEGETCGSCRHLVRGRYAKCDLRRAEWTAGYGTDVLVRSPACKYWEPTPDEAERR